MVILKVNNVCLRKIRSLHNSNTLYTVFTTNFYETDVIFWESHFFSNLSIQFFWPTQNIWTLVQNNIEHQGFHR